VESPVHASLPALIGWTGQACFFGRFLVQWLASERSDRCVVPSTFWWLSLVGTALVGGFAALRGDVLLLPGFAVGALIYARNLHLARRPGRTVRARWLWPVAGLAALVLLCCLRLEAGGPPGETRIWLALGGLGQALWVARFLVQWIASERAGRSRLPAAFWWTSLAGNLLLLAYALHLAEPLYAVGFLPGPLLQARNLLILRGGAGRVTAPGR
jgi:lipid-A-disaccharide synthase-like uncharacterized protein